MKEALKSLNPYKLIDDELGYLFISKTGREYLVQFMSMQTPVSDGEFEGVLLTNLSLYVKEGDRFILDTSKLTKEPEDARIGETIAYVIIAFFIKNPDDLLLLCFEESDKRQKSRSRMFSKWVNKYMYKHLIYMPYSESFFEFQNEKSYGGLLIYAKGLYSHSLPLTFSDLIERIKYEKNPKPVVCESQLL